MSKTKTRSSRSKSGLILATSEGRGQIESHSRSRLISTSMTRKIGRNKALSSNTLLGCNIALTSGNGISQIHQLREMVCQGIGRDLTKSIGSSRASRVIRNSFYLGQNHWIGNRELLFVKIVKISSPEKKGE